MQAITNLISAEPGMALIIASVPAIGLGLCGLTIFIGCLVLRSDF